MNKLKTLKNHTGFMRYFKNTSWLLGEKILRLVVGLFVGVWVARYLGPERFGLFSYAQSFVGLFATIATLGLDGIMVRELVKNEARRDELIGTAFWLKLMGAVGMLIILGIAVNFTSNDTFTNTLVFIIASATIFQSFNVIDFYFQSKVLSRYIVYVNIASLFSSSLVKIALILYQAPLIAFAWVIVFDNSVLALGFIYVYIKQSGVKFFHWTFSTQVALELLKDSWPLIIGGAAATIYMRIDQVMIGNMIDKEAVGFYSVATRLSEIWLFVTVALTQSFSPSITNAKKHDEILYISRIQDMYNILIKISFFISIVIFFCADKLIFLLYGTEYTASANILEIYIWSTIFVYLSNGSWLYYLNENLQKIASMRLVLGAVINIILNLFFIRYFGLVGAAYATLISYGISSYLINFFFNKTKLNFFLQTQAIINIINIKTWRTPIKYLRGQQNGNK
ncbi:MAG: flippase [Sulfurospirillaceae bacterium]|nr:flippase [Sulfurospirillaceae bacterium]